MQPEQRNGCNGGQERGWKYDGLHAEPARPEHRMIGRELLTSDERPQPIADVDEPDDPDVVPRERERREEQPSTGRFTIHSSSPMARRRRAPRKSTQMPAGLRPRNTRRP